jgi:hypothetical protein
MERIQAIRIETEAHLQVVEPTEKDINASALRLLICMHER